MTDQIVCYESAPIEGAPGVAATIVLNRPDQLNAIDAEMVAAFDAAVSRAVSEEVRCIFVTGAGRAFSAGGDLKKYIELQRDAIRFPQFVADLHAAFSRLRQLPMPVIALVNGVTVAGGLELLLSCDVAIGAATARVGDGHMNFGQMGGGGVLTLLPRIVGIQKAFDLIVTGRLLSSREAVEWGLLNDVVPDGELRDEAARLARRIAEKSPLAVKNAKQVMNTIWAEAMSVRAGLSLERDRNSVYCLTSEDAPEGLLAFAEKRSPRFTGR